MKFFEAVKSCFFNYFKFSGRSRRSEFWHFMLFNLIILIGLAFTGFGGETPKAVLFRGAGVAIDVGDIGWLFCLLIAMPSLAVGARRLHDIGKSGWWQLIWIGMLIGSLFLMGITAGLGFRDFAPVVFLISLMGSFAAFILLIVWFAKDGHPYDNRFGYSPKYGGEVSAFD